MQRAAEDGRELGVRHGLGRDGVEHAARRTSFAMAWRMSADLVVDVDPGQPLLARADVAAQAQAERRQDRREEAARAREHEPVAQDDDAQAELDGLLRLGLPVARELGEEARRRAPRPP